VPNLPGLTEIGYLTNETVFDLTQLPERLAVIGAGPIGCELAQAFARFGSEVTILDQGERVLPREDAEASRTLQAALERDRVRYVPHVELREVRGGEGEIRVYYKCEGRTGQIGVDQVLLAVGRRPNVEGIGLAEAEIEHGKKGIAVDDRLRTTNPRVYACGDVVARDLFTHAADAQARLVIQNALFSGRARASGLLIPRCTYTSPEVAHVGLNDETASLSGIATETLTVSLEGVDRAVLDGHPEGFLKLRVEKGGDRILGATLVAEHAGETIGELAVAIAARVGLGQLARVIHPYPTQAEIIKKAADTWRRGRLTNGVKRALSAYFWLRR
jgi:pyruvate/2-oxoglutarate dehydrogenase complex dihydrolipoamide dehydrogenase (E3) component